MPFPLYQGLNDDYDRHDGSLSPYVDYTNAALPIEKHYDLRMFHGTNVTVPWTFNDNTWWSGFRYPTYGVPQIGTQRSINNVTYRSRTQTELDAFTQTQLDALNQSAIESVQTGNGNEEWPVGDGTVTVGKNASYRYSNTITITLADAIANGTFDTNTTGWTTTGACTIARDTSKAHAGSASLQVNASLQDTGAVVTMSGLIPGVQYTYAYWYWVTLAQVIRPVIESPTGTFIGNGTSVIGNGNWQLMTGTFVAGAGGTAKISFMSRSPSGAAQTFWLDEVSVVTPKTVNSYYTDNILADFNVSGQNYYLELTLRGLAAQTASGHLDLSNSYIDISSDVNFAGGKTDSFRFSNSLNSLVAGGDTFARWPLTFVNADRSQIVAVRFRLASVGGATMTAQALRVVPANWPNSIVGEDTKRQTLSRQIPRAGSTEQASFPKASMLEDGSFELGITQASYMLNGNLSISQATSTLSGSKCLQMTQTAGGAFWTGMRRVDGTRIPVTGGQTYTGSAWYRNVSGSATIAVQLNWLDSGNSYVGSATGTYVSPVAGGAFVPAFLTATAPSNAVTCELYFMPDAATVASGGHVVQVDAARLEQGTVANSFLADDAMYFYQTRPKNTTTYTRFNSGHAPATGSDDNVIKQYYRYDPTTSDRLEVRLASRSTQTRLFIDQRIGGVLTNLVSTGAATNILSAETDYVLVTTLNGTSVSATVYAANGLTLGSAVGTLTGTATTTLNSRGYVGLSFEPYNYDFVISSFGSNVADFGQFLSTPFASRTSVKAATLYTRTSPAVDLLVDGSFETFGDATIVLNDGPHGTPVVDDFNRADGRTPEGVWASYALPGGGPEQLPLVINNRISIPPGQVDWTWATYQGLGPLSPPCEHYWTLTSLTGSFTDAEIGLLNSVDTTIGYTIQLGVGGANLVRLVKWSTHGYLNQSVLATITPTIPVGTGHRIGITAYENNAFGVWLDQGSGWKEIIHVTDPNVVPGPYYPYIYFQDYMTLDNFGAGEYLPATSFEVTRQGNATQGGLRYNNPVWIGNSTQVTVSGSIQPIGPIHGTYRVALIDENDSVAWLHNLNDLLPNQYNDFAFLLPPGLFPQQYYFHIQQSGSYADTFRLRDLELSHNTIGWEASVDSGTTWQPFLDAVDTRWSAVKFTAPGTGLEVRATALSDRAYIAGYNLVPRYTT